MAELETWLCPSHPKGTVTQFSYSFIQQLKESCEWPKCPEMNLIFFKTGFHAQPIEEDKTI